MADSRKVHPWPDVVALPADPEEREIAEQTFINMCRERDYASWSPWQLQQAAQMSITVAKYEVAMRTLDREGLTALGGRNGTTVVRNPMIDVCATLKGLVSQQQTKIGLAMSQIDKTTSRSKGEAEREARSRIDKNDSSDGLLA